MTEVALLGATCCGTTFLEAVAHNQRERQARERARDAIVVDGVAVDVPPPPPVPGRVQCAAVAAVAGACRLVHDTRATFENGRNHGIGDDDGGHGILSSDDVKAPPVQARGKPPTRWKCIVCRTGTGYELQTPVNVFNTAYRRGGRVEAVRNVVAMAKRLEACDEDAVNGACACCKNPLCMLKLDLLQAKQYSRWLATRQRQQEELGTARSGQNATFSDNVYLLHILHSAQGVLTESQVRALFSFVVRNSQYIQEREKRFSATAVAVARNPQAFGYTFCDPEDLIRRMARLPHAYAMRVMLPHILRTGMKPKKWEAGRKQVMDQAFPKAADVVYALMCDSNARAHSYQEDADGRLVHAVTLEQAPLFTPEGFAKALQAACSAKPKTDLAFAGGGNAALSSAHNRRKPTKKDHQERRLLDCGGRSLLTSGKAAAAFPTCGSRQLDSGVRTWKRYRSIFETDEGLTSEQADKRTRLFVDYHPRGNTVGKEKLNKTSPFSKHCHALRMPAVRAAVATASSWRNAIADKHEDMRQIRPVRSFLGWRPASRGA
jgi:hypothetical protein